jgi:hypothetical protein
MKYIGEPAGDIAGRGKTDGGIGHDGCTKSSVWRSCGGGEVEKRGGIINWRSKLDIREGEAATLLWSKAIYERTIQIQRIEAE